MATLANIRTKVRRLTGKPSVQQITDEEIDEYVNTFYLYDLPENLKLFSLHTNFEFLTIPNVDQYDMEEILITENGVTDTAANIFENLEPPVYIAGYQSFWTQDNEQFFRTYPKLAEINDTVAGNGSPGPYTFQFANTPIFQFCVTVGAIDDTGDTQRVIDVPQSRTTGDWVISNEEIPVVGSVDYIEGSGTVTFSNNIPQGNDITFTAVPYVASRPQAVKYYDNIISLRPVPDKVYKVTTNAFRTPTAFFAGAGSGSQNPQLKLWFQYLAYGAAKKIFEDTQDPEGVASIMAAYKEQESIVLRRTITQITNERTATIFTEMTEYPYNNNEGKF